MTQRSAIMSRAGIVFSQVIVFSLYCPGISLATEQVYEIDRQQIADTEQIDMQSLLAVINERFGELGRAKKTEEGKILVRLNQNGMDDEPELLKRRISVVGHLELRILANAKSPADERLVEIAGLTPVNSKQVQLKGVKIADWLPFFSKELKIDLIDEYALVFRVGLDSPEVLALPVGASPTGANVVGAERMNESDGSLAIRLRFNADGRTLLDKLEKKTEKSDNERSGSKIGLVMDGHFVGTTTRNSAANDEIVVHCDSKELAETILAIMRAGMLPYPIHLQQAVESRH